jgi:two-component system, LuxR family, response regulator FixJ
VSKPTVFLVDDDRAVRDSILFLMKSVGQHLESFSTAGEFLDAFDPTRPGCLVLDIRMPGMSGLELMAKLSELGSHLPVIIITGHADVPMAVQAMKRGALDILEKPFNDQDLLHCINAAFQADAAILQSLSEQEDVRRRLALLTPREREVFDQLVDGRSNKEIALKLGITRKTLGIHRSRVLEKMDVEGLPALVRMWMSIDR